jgi:hypothetical protein
MEKIVASLVILASGNGGQTGFPAKSGKQSYGIVAWSRFVELWEELIGSNPDKSVGLSGRNGRTEEYTKERERTWIRRFLRSAVKRRLRWLDSLTTPLRTALTATFTMTLGRVQGTLVWFIVVDLFSLSDCPKSLNPDFYIG